MKNKFLTLLFLIFSFCINVSSQNFEWVKSLNDPGSGGTCRGYFINLDNNSNLYVVGQFGGTIDFDPGSTSHTLYSSSNYDTGFILKLDSSGNFNWVLQFDNGINENLIQDFKVDSDNNLLICGYYNDSLNINTLNGDTTLYSNGIYDSYIFKIAPDGSLLWAISFGGSSVALCHGLALDSLNSIYVTGSFQSTVDFDPSPASNLITSLGSADVFISKFDSSGNYVWTKRLGNGAAQEGYSIIILDTQVISTGTFNYNSMDMDPGPGTAILSNSGDGDLYISSLDLNGNYNWAYRIGGGNYQLPDKLLADNNGYFYLAGRYRGTTDIATGTPSNVVTASSSMYDIFIAKMNSNGTSVWSRGFGGNQEEKIKSIYLDTSYAIHLTGNYRDTVDFDFGAGLEVYYGGNSDNDFFMKIDSSGNFVWAYAGTDNFHRFEYAVACDQDNNIFYTGGYTSTQDFDPFGAPLPGRNFNSSESRYGMNGQEKVDEIAGEGNHYTAEYWEYDPRTARRWNLDPKPNPSISYYATFANNPIWYSDPKGDTIVVDNKGTITRNDKTDNFVYTLQGGKMTKLGELGKTVDVNKIYKNLLKQNAREADDIWSPFTFYDNVKTGGKWDLKSNESTIYGLANTMANNGEIEQTQFSFNGSKMEAQDIGNHHFGVVGKAYGLFSETTMLKQAGAAQMRSKTSKPEWQVYLTDTYEVELPSGATVNRTTSVMVAPYGDDPRDQRWIKAGFKYFKENQETLEGKWYE